MYTYAASTEKLGQCSRYNNVYSVHVILKFLGKDFLIMIFFKFSYILYSLNSLSCY